MLPSYFTIKILVKCREYSTLGLKVLCKLLQLNCLFSTFYKTAMENNMNFSALITRAVTYAYFFSNRSIFIDFECD